MHQLYTVGYQSIKLPALKQWIENKGAWLIDVRFSPRARDPQWRQSNLENVFGFRYQWVQALGNRNFKGGPTDLVDVQTGIRIVSQLLKTADVVLMCACWSWSKCHRREVADAIVQAVGGTVYHLQPADLPKIEKSKPQLNFLETEK